MDADYHDMLDRIGELEELLEQANQAFDECTGDYAKELVADEPWRRPIKGGGGF